MEKLPEEIIEGRRLTRNDNLEFLLTINSKELCAGANKIRKELCGKKQTFVQLLMDVAEDVVKTVNSVLNLLTIMQKLKNMIF